MNQSYQKAHFLLSSSKSSVRSLVSSLRSIFIFIIVSLILPAPFSTIIMAEATSSDNLIKEAQAFVNEFNEQYEQKHLAFETQFWGTKMALSDTDDVKFNAENLSQTKKEMEDLLSDYSTLEKAQKYRDSISDTTSADDDLMKCLNIIIRTCECYTTSPDNKKIREETSQKESELEMARNRMELGYYETTKDGEDENGDGESANKKRFVSLSSVGLRNKMRTDPNETTRKAAYDGLRSIGPFVCENGFVEIIKLRNQLAKKLGYADYYDYKATVAEGMSKDKLFEILDGLEEGTRDIMINARKELEKRHGEDASQPWNIGYKMAGSVTKKMDPYFPFAKAPERYIRSYSKMNIQYSGATMNLDLLERKNKYSNGFCHWPSLAWMKPNQVWNPSTANFTSLGDPKAVGSGRTALTTLMHEAGHAAHFANIKQPSPLFGQERPPFSAALAEGQSMFLDALVGDAAWMAKYARSVNNEPIPFELIEESIRSTQPFEVFQLRAMLAVPYYEKALYELNDEDVTAEKISELADEIEIKIQGGLSPRPLLSVPHIISDEASCYYHAYVLAEMNVHQVREFFMERDGYIVDNPEVGPTLAQGYWEHGNSKNFLDLVKDVTGKELSGQAWVNKLKQTTEDVLASEKEEYDKAIKDETEAEADESCDNLDLNMTVRFVDGDTLIADSSKVDGGLLGACKEFEKFIAARG